MMNNNNKVGDEMLNLIKRGYNPEQLVLSFLQANKQNPMIGNLLNLVENKKYDEIGEIAKNVVSSRGKDFDTELKNLTSRFRG